MPSQGWSPAQLLKIVRAFPVRTIFDSLRHPLRRWCYDNWCAAPPGGRRPASLLIRPRSSARDREPLGDIVDCHTGGLIPPNCVDLVAANGILRLEVVATGLIRLRLRRAGAEGFPPLFSYALDPEAEWPPVLFDVEDSPQAVTIRTAELVCTVQKSPCRLTLTDAGANFYARCASALASIKSAKEMAAEQYRQQAIAPQVAAMETHGGKAVAFTPHPTPCGPSVTRREGMPSRGMSRVQSPALPDSMETFSSSFMRPRRSSTLFSTGWFGSL